MSTSWLPELTGSTIRVEIAWGADLTDLDGSGWTWTDITTDVRVDDGISMVHGRKDEASVASPTQITLTLDNSTGAYSTDGTSSNWPNVRRNTPVRVTADMGTTPGNYWVGFQGYAVGFAPGWTDDYGKVPTVKLTVAGLLRRMMQGTDPLHSTLYRQLTIAPPAGLTDYWPLEEDKTAGTGISATGGPVAYANPIVDTGVTYGKIAWGADTDNLATERAVQISAGMSLVLPVANPAAYSTTGTWAAKWNMRYTSGSGAFAHIQFAAGYECQLTFYTNGAVDMDYVTGPFTSTTVASVAAATSFTAFDNVWLTWTFFVDNTTTQPTWTLLLDGVSVASGTITSAKSVPSQVIVDSVPDPGGTEDPVSIAHVALFTNPSATLWTVRGPETAWVGEGCLNRMDRLAVEEGFLLTRFDPGEAGGVAMDAQLPKSLIDLLRECEAVGQGVLFDGAWGLPGLYYIGYQAREDRGTDMPLTAAQIVPPFAPADDDQGIVNRVTASTTVTTSKVTYTDSSSRLGTAAIGVYDSSIAVNLDDPNRLADYAGWAVHRGTYEGYRYPTLTFDLRAVPSVYYYLYLLWFWSTSVVSPISKRIKVDNTAGTITGLPLDVIDLLVEGVTINFGPRTALFTFNLSPAQPWRVGVLAATTGDAGEFVLRLEPDVCAVSTSASAGATSLTVSTTGPLWTTTADDYPLDLSVGGVKVHATACSSASGTHQTFTVSALSIARASGLPVEVWNDPVLGL